MGSLLACSCLLGVRGKCTPDTSSSWKTIRAVALVLNALSLCDCQVSDATSSAPVAQYNSNGYWRLLVVEWYGVTSAQTLTLLQGSTPMPVTLSTMKLPILFTTPSQQPKAFGPAATFVQAYTPVSPPDVSSMVEYDMTAFKPLYSATSTTAGLNFIMPPNAAAKAGSILYVRTVGYLKSPTTALGTMTLTVTQPAGQQNLIVVGSVVLRNGLGFSTASGQLVYKYELSVPAGYVSLEYISKYVASSSKGATLSTSIVGGVLKSTVAVSNSMWMQAANATQSQLVGCGVDQHFGCSLIV